MKDPRSDAISYVVAKASEEIDWATVTDTVGGVKVAKITVFFEAFARDNSGSSITTDELNVLNNATVGNSLIVNGNITASQNLNVSGAITTSGLTVTGVSTLDSLIVNGNANIAGNLTVSGDTTVEDLYVNGRIITTGNTPTVANGSVLGALDVTDVEGNDSAGLVTVEFDATSTPVVGEQVVVTFDETYTAAPRIALTAKDANSATVRTFVETSTTGFTVHFIDAPVAGETYTFDYIVIQ